MAIKTEYKGHSIACHPDGTFEVSAYGRTFRSEKDAREFLDQHVADEAKKSLGLMDIIKGTNKHVLVADRLIKNAAHTYDKRTGTPGHYKYEYHAANAKAASDRASNSENMASAFRGKKASKLDKVLAHEQASDAHSRAARHARSLGDDRKASAHQKIADRHLEHPDHLAGSDGIESSMSGDEHTEAYHRYTEQARSTVDPAGDEAHKHEHAAMLHGSAFDHAMNAHDFHMKEAAKIEAKHATGKNTVRHDADSHADSVAHKEHMKQAKRMEANASLAHDKMKHHNSKAGLHEIAGTAKSMGDNSDIAKASKSGDRSKEGSRGGNIIGRTGTGKPIYASHAGNFKQHTKNYTREDHEDAMSSHHSHRVNHSDAASAHYQRQGAAFNRTGPKASADYQYSQDQEHAHQHASEYHDTIASVHEHLAAGMEFNEHHLTALRHDDHPDVPEHDEVAISHEHVAAAMSAKTKGAKDGTFDKHTPEPYTGVESRKSLDDALDLLKGGKKGGFGGLDTEVMFSDNPEGGKNRKKIEKMGASPMAVAMSEDPAIDGEAPTGRGSKTFGIKYSKKIKKQYGMGE